MVLTKKVEVRASAIAGSGLYAVERIAKGEEYVKPPAAQHRAAAATGAPARHAAAAARAPALRRIWRPDEDEQTKYYRSMTEIKTWSEEEQKHFMNNAYLVGEIDGVKMYSGERRAACCRARALTEPAAIADRAQHCASGSAAAAAAAPTAARRPPPSSSSAAARRALRRGERQGRVHEPLLRAERP
jgi:hypothetical protein